MIKDFWFDRVNPLFALIAQFFIFLLVGSDLIRENKIFQIPNIMQTARAEGMISMENSIKTLIMENKISPSNSV